MTAVLPGFVVAAIGFVTLFVLLGKRGALAKSKQFAALGDLASGRAGSGMRVGFFFALIAMGLGSCLCFAGVAASDSKRRETCAATCKGKGYAKSSIRGSTATAPGQPNRHAFVACACESGPAPDPLELDANSL